MENRTKQYLLVTAAGVALFAALMNFSVVLRALGGMFELGLPILAGSILALFINVPMNGIEKRLRRLGGKMKNRPSDKMIHMASFFMTAVGILAVLVLVLTLLVPEIMRSSQSLYAQIEHDIPQWIAYLDARQIDADWMEEFFSDINFDRIMQGITKGVDTLFSNVAIAVSSTVSVVITTAFAIIISIYMALDRERVCRHANKLVRAYLKPAWAENVLRFCRMFYESFANFLSGQCCEAVILGILVFAAFMTFRLPYGSLVGVLTAVCAIIPYIGGFISCAVSIFLTLIYDPGLVVRCAIVYLVVQFVENQFIYPKVVGKSVGLPPFYTLVAALVGGKLFGILGMLFAIPFMAVVMELVKEDAARRLDKTL